jgi:hypothetical protein
MKLTIELTCKLFYNQQNILLYCHFSCSDRRAGYVDYTLWRDKCRATTPIREPIFVIGMRTPPKKICGVTNITTFQGFPMAKRTQIWNFPHYLDPSFYRIEEYLPGRLLIIFIVSLDITYRSGQYCRYRGRYIYRLYQPYRTKH